MIAVKWGEGVGNENYERLAVVEEQIKQLEVVISDLRNDIREWQKKSEGVYIPRQELTEMFRSRDRSISELRESLKSAANQSDIVDIKNSLKELKDENASKRPLYAAWAGVGVSALAVIVTIITLIAG
ncbi:hypothetical protein [Mesobacillus foraminis]|jgi:chromosome segregation ATPase|uniref:Uncharacterized protein n=1 Tax=Mesobacillus foraminis TaxID=279826 RepID=A0A4R2BMA9_9BACI|nr:hypothetical protein [Mesobacillus foraminis]TCN27184.1 hypothetical protein EV146_102129 [Mesobacillus foraminis]